MKDLIAEKPYLYMQYRQNSILQAFNKSMQESMQEYYDLLQEWLKAWDYRESESNYIFFWAQNVLGLPNLWGSPQANTFYDSSDKYDSEGLVYDNYSDLTPFVSPREMVAYTKFLMDYSRQTLSIPFLIAFCADYCQCDIGDFKIELDNANENLNAGKLKITIPNTELGLSLYTTLTAQELIGMPAGEAIIWQINKS